MRNWMLISAMVFFFCTNAFGQNAGKQTKKSKDAMLRDVFKGNIPAKGYADTTELVLEHLRFYDIGAFTLSQKSKNATLKKTGQWTVLKGSAKDDNATVVELDAPGGNLYFLRLKNGSLQQLDTLLREMKPLGKYVLVKQGK